MSASASRSFEEAQQETLTVRFSRAADMPKIMKFYQVNRHNSVDIRKINVMEEAIENGRFILVEKDDGTLCAGSGGYDFAGDNPLTEPRKWIEFGTTRATLPGFGLYPYLIACQVIYEFLKQPPDDCFVAIVDYDNEPVKHLLGVKTGWKDFTAPAELKNKLKDTKEWSSANPYVWLCGSSDTLSHQARLVLELIDKGELVNKKTGVSMKLDLSELPLANEMLSCVKALANGVFAEKLESSPHKPLAEVRQALEVYMKGRVNFPQPGL